MTTSRQFALLLWKNYVLQMRHKVVTALELALPALLMVLLVFIRKLSPIEDIPTPTFYPEFDLSTLPARLPPAQLLRLTDIDKLTAYKYSLSPWPIAFAPDTPLTHTIMAGVSKYLNVNSTGLSFSNEIELQEYITSTSEDILAGVIFPDLKENSSFSNDIRYEIRMRPPHRSQHKNSPFTIDNWETHHMYPVFQRPIPRESKSPFGGKPGYFDEGFLAVQHGVALSIIEFLSGQLVDKVEVKMQRFPFPRYVNDKFLVALQQWLSMVIMVSFLYPAVNLVKSLTHEKEQKLKESMKMMGLSSWLHWAAWFTKSFVFLFLSCSAMVFLLCGRIFHKMAVLDKSNPYVLFFFLLVYIACSISFCFMVSVFFSKANSAATAGGFLWFMSYIPFFFIQPRYSTMSWSSKIFCCLIFNTAMAMGGRIITMHEGTGEGIQWVNVSKGVTPDDEFTLYSVIMMLLLDGCLYGIVTWYVEAVFPGDYGIPQPWSFPFTKSYWCGIAFTEDIEVTLSKTKQQTHPEYFEKEPVGLYSGIRIKNLTKIFQKQKIIVNQMNLNMYEGQITVLLGHNGAGKTTTMSILTGLITASQGTAIISGYNIRKNMQSVRHSLGLCPQHDVLFDDLTVAEHLYFFCRLKNSPMEKVLEEINHTLKALQFEDKRNALIRTLSGGMKRKLSVGIALIGGSKVVMLDEPTSGMDPAARRATWDLLQKERQGRTILLTTHFMDEADLLGDRIAIMAKGELQCCGSPLFLKKKYGAGYHMIIVKQPHCNETQITNLIKQHLPAAELESNIGAELSYILPHEGSSKFEKLFTVLEKNQENLGISSYGASITTMEEVFLRVGEVGGEGLKSMLLQSNGISDFEDQIKKNTNDFYPSKTAFMNDALPKSVKFACKKRNEGLELYYQQFWAMFIKRVLHTRRNWLLTLTQLFIPIFFVIIGFLVAKTVPNTKNPVPLILNLDAFGRTQVTYFMGNKASHSLQEELSHSYRQMFSNSEHVYVSDFLNYSSIDQFLLQKSEENLPSFNLQYIVGGSFHFNQSTNKTIAIAHFNNQPFHGAGISLSKMDSALLSHFTKNSSLKFIVINKPLPPSASDDLQHDQPSSLGFSIAFDLVFGISFLSSSFVIFLIKERSSKAKHLQVVSGVHFTIFWISTFLWDFINYLMPCFCILLVFVIFNEDGYNTADMQARYFTVFLLYGWSMLPLMYALSFLFKIPSTGFTRLAMFNILSGVATLLTVTILQIPELDLLSWAKTLDWMFLVLPNYCLGWAFFDLFRNHQILQLCQHPFIKPYCDFAKAGKCDTMPCPEFQENYLAWEKPGIGRMIVFLIGQGFVFFAVILLIETEILHQIGSYLKKIACCSYSSSTHQVYIQLSQDPLVSSDQEIGMLDSQDDLPDDHELQLEDDDVANEKDRIENMPLGQLLATDNLILRELTKYYDDFLAVDHISVGIPRGECFGLLGVNGAGKTTTFKMLTGDESISDGDATVEGYSVVRHLKEVQQRIGYCPQFDAVIDQMTGRETLVMFARLRGVPEKCIDDLIVSLAENLLLAEHLDKLAKDYSGGNKRKLSTAVSLIGNPPIVFLDEPTTGMDPLARRLLWDAISRVRDSGHSIILTSHSMEECDVLCTRLAIMVNGQFRCLGSPQHLKNKFGQGYTLIVKVRVHENSDDATDELSSVDGIIQKLRGFIESSFPGSVLKDLHQGMAHYHIQNPKLSWAYIFGTMERAKERYCIEDYSVSQTTLEQVFLNFARAQRPTDIT